MTAAMVGRSTRRIDAPGKLTGAERYTADISLPRMLHACLVTSIYANARIRGVDTRAARAVPGVVGAFSAADVESLWAVRPIPPPLAPERAVYYGQPVAVVVAESEAIAEEAAALVQVDYEPLPPVTDVELGILPDAPEAVDETMRAGVAGAAHTEVSSGAGPERALPPNATGYLHFTRGDVTQGFAQSDVVVTRTYRTHRTHHGYMEPHATVAAVDPAGNLSVWTATQAMFFCRSAVSRATGVPESKVQLTAMPVGGGFGGKYIPLYEPLVALLALKTRRPVRLVLSRIEEFTSTNPAPSCVIELTTGAKKDGTLHALKARVLFDTGAYRGEVSTDGACMALGGCYRIQHLDIEAFDVYTNKTPPGSYRAPGAPQGTFAIESNMSIMARELGLDDLTFRLMNVVQEGDLRPDNLPWKSVAVRQCLEELQQHPAWTAPRGPDEGVGLAVGAWGGLCEPASAICRLNEDGTLAVTLGSQDISGSNTSFALMAAETFGIDVEKVQVIAADSLTAPYAGVAGGSKTTYTVGGAVVQAATAARRQLLAIAAEELETSPEDLEIAGDTVRVKGSPGSGVGIAELARMTMVFGGRHAPVYASGTVAQATGFPGAAAHLARVRVDRETGDVRIVRYVAVQDVGRAINPAEVEGQIEGGVVQGVGWALYEGIVYDENGTVLTASFLDYAMPHMNAVPEIETIVLEVPAPEGPFGLKGVGEPPVVPGAGAIANAVADAVGVRLHTIPLTAEEIVRGL